MKEDNLLELEIYNTFANVISAMRFEENNIRGVYIGDKKDDWTKFKEEGLEYGLLRPPKLLLFRK